MKSELTHENKFSEKPAEDWFVLKFVEMMFVEGRL